MTSNGRILALIVLVISLLVLGYVAVAFYKYLQYSRLSEQAPAENVVWSIKALNDEHYQLHAAYDYHVKGEVFHGETTFSDAHYRNPYAAEQGLKEVGPEYKTVWYDPSKPSVSCMEKAFPVKLVTYAAILFALWNYFVWGGYIYIKKW